MIFILFFLKIVKICVIYGIKIKLINELILKINNDVLCIIISYLFLFFIYNICFKILY